jgi:putative transposase
LVRAPKTSQPLALRARILLRLAEGVTAPEVARRVGTTRPTVRLWRPHWLERAAEPVVPRLQDAPRPGAPLTSSAEPWRHLMALACEPPEQSGRPISPWPPRALADEAVNRQIVERLSPRHGGRVLKSGGVKPPSESFLAQP